MQQQSRQGFLHHGMPSVHPDPEAAIFCLGHWQRFCVSTDNWLPAGKNPGAFSEPVVTQAGTTFFKTVNFELYAKPTNRNKAMAYVGSAIFVGIMAYFTVMDYQDIQKAKEGAAAPPAAS